MSDYHVELRKGWLREKKLGIYSTSDGAISAAKKHGPGTYNIVTIWDGEFDREHIKVTETGDILIQTNNILGPGWLRYASYSARTQYVLDQAIAINQFYSKEEQEAARRRIKEFERTQAVSQPE